MTGEDREWIDMATKMTITVEIANDAGEVMKFNRTDEIPSFEDFETKGFRACFDNIETSVLEARKEVCDNAMASYLSDISKKSRKAG